jgi:hypothetical protein
MNVVDDKPPIFIVGVPRSGTTLLAAMLNAHSRLSCGTETRFFRFLSGVDLDELCDQRTWPDMAVDYLFSLKLVDKPVPEHYAVTKEQIYTYLRVHPPTIPSILSSLTELFMRKEGKCRWVEKSPEHLLYVDEIRKYFPQSPIIRIVRDPRDVALSLVKAPWAPPDYLDALLYWCDYDERSEGFFQYDRKSYTIFYENLVQSPESELRKLCVFIGEDFENEMLDTSNSAAKVVTEMDAWHRIVHKPVDKTRTQVWKRELTNEQNRITESLIGDRILTYEYDREESFDHKAIVYPSIDALLKYRLSLKKFVDEGVRFFEMDYDDKDHYVIYVGDPDLDKWLRYKQIERWWDTVRIIAKILIGKLTNQHIYWVRETTDDAKPSYSSRLIAFVLQFITESQSRVKSGFIS